MQVSSQVLAQVVCACGHRIQEQGQTIDHFIYIRPGTKIVVLIKLTMVGSDVRNKPRPSNEGGIWYDSCLAGQLQVVAFIS